MIVDIVKRRYRVKKKKMSSYKEYWKKVMKSTKNKMSQGAAKISKSISWARGENWRGKKEKKK